MDDIGPAQAGESALPEELQPPTQPQPPELPTPGPAPSLAEIESANYQRTLGE